MNIPYREKLEQILYNHFCDAKGSFSMNEMYVEKHPELQAAVDTWKKAKEMIDGVQPVLNRELGLDQSMYTFYPSAGAVDEIQNKLERLGGKDPDVREARNAWNDKCDTINKDMKERIWSAPTEELLAVAGEIMHAFENIEV